MLNTIRCLWLSSIQLVKSALTKPRMQLAYAPARRLGSAIVILGALSGSAAAQLSETTVSSMGLQTMWQAQLQMPVMNGRIVSTHLWTNPAGAERVYAEIVWPKGTPASVMATGRSLRVSADRLGAGGKPIGIEAAKQEVETLAMRMLRRPSGLTAKEIRIRTIHFIVVTSDGFIQSFDAETGEKLWSNSCASPQYPTMPASIGEAGLAVSQGPYLHLFDLVTGKEITRRHMDRATSTGVAMANKRAFLSALSGQLTTVDFTEEATAPRWSFRLYGRTAIAPATSDAAHNLVAFGTANGYVTVLSSGERIEPWFNFEAKAPLVPPLTFIGDALYVGDISGQFSKLSLEHSGKIQWRLLLGSALGSQPLLIDKALYVNNEVGELFAVDNGTGRLLWGPTPRCKAILAGTQDRLYCRSLTDRLLVIDRSSGSILNQTGESLIGTTVVNQLTDRVIVISEGGKIQALRTPGDENVDPKFQLPLPVVSEKQKSSKPEAAAAPEMAGGDAAMPAAADAADPFGAGVGGASPAGAPTTPAPAADDPFAAPMTPAAGSNPF